MKQPLYPCTKLHQNVHVIQLPGIQSEKCVLIEDSTNGIKAAKAAGIYCIAFAGPGSELQDQSQADLIIKDFGEIDF